MKDLKRMLPPDYFTDESAEEAESDQSEPTNQDSDFSESSQDTDDELSYDESIDIDVQEIQTRFKQTLLNRVKTLQNFFISTSISNSAGRKAW